MLVVFHPPVLHNKSDSRFNSGSIAVDIYDVVNGAQILKKDNRDKLHTSNPDLTRGCEVTKFVFFLKIDSTHRGFGE